MTNSEIRLLELLKEHSDALPYSVDAVYSDFWYMLYNAKAHTVFTFQELSEQGLIALVNRIIAIEPCSTDIFMKKISWFIDHYKEGE